MKERCCSSSFSFFPKVILTIFMLFLLFGLVSTPDADAQTCSATVDFQYDPTGFSDTGDQRDILIGLGAGNIQSGNFLTVNRVRVNLDCSNADINCTDAGALVSFVGVGTNANAADDCPTTWSAAANPGNSNQIIITADTPFNINANTVQECILPVTVQVDDITAGNILQVHGYDLIENDAVCDNNIPAGAEPTGFIQVCDVCDTDFCDGEDVCNNDTGECEVDPGTIPDCSGLNDACNEGICDEGIDQCVANPINNGVICSDSNVECQALACDAGSCTLPVPDPNEVGQSCTDNDGNSCTEALCTANGTCEQNNPTNENQVCSDLGSPDICEQNLCRSGVCSALPDPSQNGNICDDSQEECLALACLEGSCSDPVPDPNEIGQSCTDNDGNSCTEALCTANGTCEQNNPTNENQVCSDLGDPEVCEENLCISGSCTPQPDASQDGNICGDSQVVCQQLECLSGECVAANLEDGPQDGCNADEDCFSEECVAGSCIQSNDPQGTTCPDESPDNPCDNYVCDGQGTCGIDPGNCSEIADCQIVIGDYVWIDENEDGIQTDDPEFCVGSMVTLSEGGDFCDETDVETTSTDDSGFYEFIVSGVDSTTCQPVDREFKITIDNSLTNCDGFDGTTQMAGEDPEIDSDCDPTKSCTDCLGPYTAGDMDLTIDCGYIPGGGQGCTPGYWKQEHHFKDWCDKYSPDDLFSDVFEPVPEYAGLTLIQVLDLPKNDKTGLNILAFHTIAALLNGCSECVSSGFSDLGVITAFNAVHPGSKSEYNSLKNQFAADNEMGCPLNNNTCASCDEGEAVCAEE